MTATQLDKKIETVLETLILKGKTSGTLPFDEIHTAIPAASLGVNALETLTEILDRIEDAGIQVAESGDAAARPPAGAPMPVATKPLSTVAHRGGTRAHQPVLEKIDDPVRMYLTQMGEIPLLTRIEEVSLAKKTEVSRKIFRRLVLESGLALDPVLEFLGQVKDGMVPFDRTLKACFLV